MFRPYWSFRKRWLMCLAPAFITGCSCLCGGSHIDNHANVPPGAIPAPLGAYVRAAQEIQAAKAEQDDFTVYLHEWTNGGPKLGPYGTYHLHQMIGRLSRVPFPIIIQVDSSDESLNVARRNLILDAVLAAGIPNAMQRVILGFPEPGGLYGEEIEPIYTQMVRPERGFDQSGTGFGRNILPGFGGFPGLGGFGGFGGGGFGGGGFGGGFGR